MTTTDSAFEEIYRRYQRVCVHWGAEQLPPAELLEILQEIALADEASETQLQ